MTALASDSYARRRLLDLLGIERYVPRGTGADRDAVAKTGVGGASAPMLSGKLRNASIGAEAPPTGGHIAISCDGHAARQYPKFIAHLARAIGVDVAAFTRRIDAPHTICFGATQPDGPSTHAPPLATLRGSAAAKRAFWRTLRDLRRILASR